MPNGICSHCGKSLSQIPFTEGSYVRDQESEEKIDRRRYRLLFLTVKSAYDRISQLTNVERMGENTRIER